MNKSFDFYLSHSNSNVSNLQKPSIISSILEVLYTPGWYRFRGRKFIQRKPITKKITDSFWRNTGLDKLISGHQRIRIMLPTTYSTEIGTFLRMKPTSRISFPNFSQNCNTSSVSSAFKHSPGKTITFRSFLSSRYTDEFQKKAANFWVRFGHSFCQRKWLNERGDSWKFSQNMRKNIRGYQRLPKCNTWHFYFLHKCMKTRELTV